MNTVIRRSVMLLCTLLVLGVTDPLLAAPIQPTASTTAPAAMAGSIPNTGAYRCDSADRKDWYKAHPTQAGQSCIPGAGWGKITRKTVGGYNVIIPFDTPYFTSSRESLSYICTTEELLRTPVMRSWYANIPGRFNAGDQVLTSGCRTPSRWVDVAFPFDDGYLDEACWVTDPESVLRGYDGRPCEHRNRWLTGPSGGFSVCDLKACQTIGHVAQRGYEVFLAHKETWSYVGWYPETEKTVFVPCGTPCDPSDEECPDNDPTCPTPDPVCEPDDPTCPTPPICTEPTCAPPPPLFCDVNPSDPRCRIDDSKLDGVRIEVVIDVPDVYATKGTLRPQGARVRSIALLCGTRPCTTGEDSVDPSVVAVTGRLVLRADNRSYRECASSRSSSCAYYPTTTDTTTKLQVGDQVLAAFFTPTRPDQRMLVKIDDPNAVVRIYALVPEYEWTRVECTGERTAQCRDYGHYYAWVPGTRTVRAPIRDIAIPVVIRDSNGVVLPTAGLTRQVIGSIGN